MTKGLHNLPAADFNNSLGLLKGLIAILSFLAFTTVTVIGSNFFYLAVGLFLLFGCLIVRRSPMFDRQLFYFLSFFILPFLIGLIGYLPAFFFESDRFDYSQLNFWGRLLNLLTFYFIILSVYKITKNGNLYLVFKWYQIGIFVLLLTALWHAVSLYTDMIEWPFDTRSNLHSTYGATYSLAKRVTGIAREPSFLVMYIVDFVALSFLFFHGFKRNFLILFACLLMVLSLSPSGYLVLGLSFLLAYSFNSLKYLSGIKMVRFIGVILTMVFLFVYLYASNNQFIDYIISRVSNVDAGNSGRLYMLLGPLSWVQESTPFSLLFGHGLKSYSIIGTYYSLPSGEPIHVTSNNLYVDILWESGIVGLLLLILYFIYIFKKIWAIRFSSSNSFIALFIFFDLLLSAFFRADYATFRFFIMLYLLFLLVNHNYNKPQKERN